MAQQDDAPLGNLKHQAKNDLVDHSDSRFGDYFRQFFQALKDSYHTITNLSTKEKYDYALSIKTEANNFFKSKKYFKALKLYKESILCLDILLFEAKQQNRNKSKICNAETLESKSNNNNDNSKEYSELICVILSNMAQATMEIANKFKNKVNNEYKYKMYLIYSLNYCNSSLKLDKNNVKSQYRKILILLRLGLISHAQELIEKFRMRLNNNNDIRQKYEKELTNQMKDCIDCESSIIVKKYKNQINNYWSKNENNVIYDFDDDDDKQMCLNIKDNQVYDVLIYVSKLYFANDLQYDKLCELILHLKNMDIDEYEHSSTYDDDILYGNYLSVISTLFNLNTNALAKLLHNFCHKKYEIEIDNWENYQKLFKAMKIIGKISTNNSNIFWISEFNHWELVINKFVKLCNISDIDIIEAIKKDSLNYLIKLGQDKTHIEWKKYYEIHCSNIQNTKTNGKTSLLPYDGRLKPLPPWNWEKGNDNAISEPDLLNIHALATSMNQLKVLNEIENSTNRIMYHLGYTWLHWYAREGCYNTVLFLINNGFAVNVLDQDNNDKYKSTRHHWTEQPNTPFDFCLLFAKTNKGVQSSNKIENVTKTMLILLENGGKRYQDLKNNIDINKKYPTKADKEKYIVKLLQIVSKESPYPHYPQAQFFKQFNESMYGMIDSFHK